MGDRTRTAREEVAANLVVGTVGVVPVHRFLRFSTVAFSTVALPAQSNRRTERFAQCLSGSMGGRSSGTILSYFYST